MRRRFRAAFIAARVPRVAPWNDWPRAMVVKISGLDVATLFLRISRTAGSGIVAPNAPAIAQNAAVKIPVRFISSRLQCFFQRRKPEVYGLPDRVSFGQAELFRRGLDFLPLCFREADCKRVPALLRAGFLVCFRPHVFLVALKTTARNKNLVFFSNTRTLRPCLDQKNRIKTRRFPFAFRPHLWSESKQLQKRWALAMPRLSASPLA